MKPALSFSRCLSSAHLSLNLLGHFQLLWGFKKQSRSDSVSLLCNCIACPRSLAYHLCLRALHWQKGEIVNGHWKTLKAITCSMALSLVTLPCWMFMSSLIIAVAVTSESLFITLFPLVCSFTVSYSMWLLWRKKTPLLSSVLQRALLQFLS